MQRSWQEREKLIENAATVMGELSGVVPKGSIPQIEKIPSLENFAQNENS